jgi:glycosyltransferase involved in cell wall biosynthesis
MRVLHVIPSLAPRDGGPGRVAIGMCRALQARGIETLVATTVSDADEVAIPSSGVTTSLHGLQVVGFGRSDDAFKYSRALSRWLRANVRHFDAVHVHAVFSHASLAAGRACRLGEVPYVVRPLGSLDPWALSRHQWRKRLLQPAVQALLDGASAVHFMTDEEARLAATGESGPRRRVRSAVIPGGIDEPYLEAGRKMTTDREPIVVAIARLHPVKRLDALIRAFHSIAGDRSLAAWRLIVAGDGDVAYRDELQRIAASGAGRTRVDFPGWLDEPAKLALLARASLIAVPSFQENFGLGLVEALACGVPAVVSRGVNLSNAIERAGAGWVMDDDSDQALLDALRTAMRDADARRTRSVAARELASQFGWTSAAASLEALYATMRPAGVGDRA